jgi:PAS domain S-box-containing protein
MSRSSLPLRYGVALVSVASALVLKLLLDQFIVQETPFLLVFGAIMVSAWYGGLGPGILATALAALITDYFFLYPTGTFSGFSLESVPLAAFVLEGVLVSTLAAALKFATTRAEVSAHEARTHQERFRLLVEGVKDYAIFMLDTDGRVVSWNEGAERIEGYRAEEIIGRHFSVFYTEEDTQRGHPESELRVAASEGDYEEEGLRVRKDGSRFWASALITALRDESGTLRGFSKLVRDITERKEAEEALQRSFDSLLALYEAGRVLGTSLEREEISSRLLEIIERVSGLQAVAIDLRDEQGRMGERRSAGAEEILASARNQPRVQAAIYNASEGGQPRSIELWPPDMEAAQPLTGVFLPLLVRERVIGVLEAYGSRVVADKEAMETLVSLASQAASALENARLYEELAERRRELQDLVGRVLTAQEEERRRVAYEVHDGFTQMAAAAYRRLQTFVEHRPPEFVEDREELERIVTLVQQTVGEARRVIADLRPTTLDDFGLSTAIRLQVEELRAGGYEASYEDALGEKRLPGMLETALFRVAQEALTNVQKHAQSNRVRVALGRRDGVVRLEVRDWGCGFDLAEVSGGGGPGERVGLSSMRERVILLGGELEIRSEPGEGTSVVAEVPLTVTRGEVDHEG